MDRLTVTLSSGNNGHPSEDELLLLVDGELVPKMAAILRSHLDACWSCRVRTEKIQDAISTFIDYRNQVLKPLAEPPPNKWRGFDGGLSSLVKEAGRPSWVANLRGVLGRMLLAPDSSINLYVLMSTAAAILILAIALGVLFHSNPERTETTSEILQLVSQVQQREVASTNQAVIYQKLQVRRKTSSTASPRTITWEVWNDIANSRTRQSVDENGSRKFVDLDHDAANNSHAAAISDEHSSLKSLRDVNTVLRANHMNAARPLSASSFEGWRQSLRSPHEDVMKSVASDGHRVLTLKVVPIEQVSTGAIVEATLVVRESDWHPVRESLRVRSGNNQGDEEFELVETDYSVLSLSTLKSGIFDDQPVVVSSPTVQPSPAKKGTPSSSPNPQPLTIAPVASVDLEVEVLGLLNQVGADLGEQINTVRTLDGLLRVTGLVDSDERKAEVLRALQPVVNNPAVRVEIQTVAEAVARQQQQNARSNATPGAVTEQKVEINSDVIAAAPELRRHFANDDEVRGFAAREMALSRSARRHVYAIKRLLGQLSPEDVGALTPEAKRKWVGLIRSHALSYKNELAILRRELQPIFAPDGAGGEEGNNGTIADDASLVRAADQLFVLASANDGVIRAAFATSSETSGTSAISSPQFWGTLKAAEDVAERIAQGH